MLLITFRKLFCKSLLIEVIIFSQRCWKTRWHKHILIFPKKNLFVKNHERKEMFYFNNRIQLRCFFKNCSSVMLKLSLPFGITLSTSCLILNKIRIRINFKILIITYQIQQLLCHTKRMNIFLHPTDKFKLSFFCTTTL